ncbi:MAG: hypothetical protein OXL34_15490 [Gemmatimonadota bacterium]|nr:hypothetical protein [Gemmatimonadota bacterium]
MSPRHTKDTGGDSLSRAVRRTEGVQPWRRVFHMLCGVAMAAAVHLIGPGSVVPVATLAGALAAALALDWIRLRSRAANRRFFRFFSALASPREARKLASSTWFLLGALTVLVVTPDRVFVPAMLVLALADPSASVIGRLWGRHKLGKGSWEGTAAFFVVATAVLVPFAGLQAALVAAAAVAVLEVMPIGIDDNLTVPLATALVLWLLGAA